MALLAVLVVGTGAVLLPRDAKPQAVPFSETARSEALSETEVLATSASLLKGAELGASGETPEASGMSGTEALLTSQARALLSPSSPTASPIAHPTGSTGRASSTAGPTKDHPTRAGFVSALSLSASRRLVDASKADGGIARLLAAVGTSQLLESLRLATAWGLPAPAPETTADAASAQATPPSCPTPAGPPGKSSAASTRADLPTALAAVVSSEQEAVYAYQVAVTKLDPKTSGAATGWLARHQELLRGAEAQGRLHCLATPPREAGYRLPATFAANPAAALGSMEASSMAAYADLVALSQGETRQWAIDGLVDTAKRSQAWGTSVGPLPGLPIDDGALPPLPTTAPLP